MSGPGRFDLHVHSRYSADAHGTILELARAAAAAGLAGFALTDHNTTRGHRDIQAAATATGQIIVPGIEVSSRAGHVLAIGVRDDIPRRQSLEDTVAAITASGGVAIPSHPLKRPSGIGADALRRFAAAGGVAAEARNGRCQPAAQAATATAVAQAHLAGTGGSDAHWIHDIGTCWSALDATTADDVVSALARGACVAGGGALPRRRVWRHSATVPWRVAWHQLRRQN